MAQTLTFPEIMGFYAPRKSAIMLVVAVLLGAALGLYAGGDALTKKGSTRPRHPDRSPAPQEIGFDPVAHDMGYTMAFSTGKKDPSDCSSLAPGFRSGCLEYVEETIQGKASPPAGARLP